MTSQIKKPNTLWDSWHRMILQDTHHSCQIPVRFSSVQSLYENIVDYFGQDAVEH